MITIKLANGKEVSSSNGEEIYHFHKSEGRSIIEEKPKQVKKEIKPTEGVYNSLLSE